MKEREDRDMDKKVLKFIVYILNLIIGVGIEIDYFWQYMLFKECSECFDIDKAIKYNEYLDNKEEILNRETVNMNAFSTPFTFLLPVFI